ncbi:hypothetical protein RJT34_32937 [Clitoria ternatea]|uniref:Uncharacterized protein n=1 Tax=Clitoria ternatea TaxID=43366 RepID=A0AAN9EZE8_CLITE
MNEGRMRESVCNCMFPVKMIIESVKIIMGNKLVFTWIMLLTALPLSTLVISQSISTHSLTTQIHHLEALARFAPTRFEARHVFRESRNDAVSLIRIKALFSLPSYFLSLAAALSAIHSTLLALHSPAATALRPAALRLFATSIFAYTVLFAFSPIPRVLASLASPTSLRLLLLTVGSVVEVYLMAVTSLSLVVSVAEERFGWDATRVGFGLMAENRVCGWTLAGVFVFASSLIGLKVESLMDGEDWMGVGNVIVCYGLLVMWSYVVMTVFYCDCRRRHPVKESQQDGDEDQQQQYQLSVVTVNVTAWYFGYHECYLPQPLPLLEIAPSSPFCVFSLFGSVSGTAMEKDSGKKKEQLSLETCNSDAQKVDDNPVLEPTNAPVKSNVGTNQLKEKVKVWLLTSLSLP